jgi:hypothetical protein
MPVDSCIQVETVRALVGLRFSSNQWSTRSCTSAMNWARAASGRPANRSSSAERLHQVPRNRASTHDVRAARAQRGKPYRTIA